MYFIVTPRIFDLQKKLNDKLTHHVNEILKVFFTDKMIITSILLSKVGPPCGMTGSVGTGRHSHTKHRNTQSGHFMQHIQLHNL